MIDIGANLLHDQFDHDRSAVLERAHRAGVQEIIVTATNLPTTQACQAFVAQWSGTPALFTTAGVHPHDAAGAPADFAAQLERMALHPDVVAIGEAGLDYNRNFSPRDVQRRVFAAQAELAVKLERTLFVHDRESNGEVLEILTQCGNPPDKVVIHCFTGTAAELDAYLAAGYWVGITGWVCDKKRGGPLRDIVTRIPLERLLIETDAPYLMPHTVPKSARISSRRNEPGYLSYVVATLAELYAIAEQTLVSATTANARNAFSLIG